MLKEGHNKLEGNGKYEGYVVDLIALIAKEINITYEFRLRSDGNGKRDKKTNKWNGIIGEVQEMVTDLFFIKYCILFVFTFYLLYLLELYKYIIALSNVLFNNARFPYYVYPIIAK